MALCLHKSCNHENREWIPTIEANSNDIILQPWCIFCGLVKNNSDDKGKKLSYWINSITSLNKIYKIAQVQKRLIINEIIKNEIFNDTYATTGTAQRKLFIKIVKKYCKLSNEEINGIFY